MAILKTVSNTRLNRKIELLTKIDVYLEREIYDLSSHGLSELFNMFDL